MRPTLGTTILSLPNKFTVQRGEEIFGFFYVSSLPNPQPPPYPLSLIKHVNLCFRRAFACAQSVRVYRVKQNNNRQTLSAYDAYPSIGAYWISAAVAGGERRGRCRQRRRRRRFYGFLMRGKKIINVLCFINLLKVHRARGRRKSPSDKRRVSVDTRETLYYIMVLYYLYIDIYCYYYFIRVRIVSRIRFFVLVAFRPLAAPIVHCTVYCCLFLHEIHV